MLNKILIWNNVNNNDMVITLMDQISIYTSRSIFVVHISALVDCVAEDDESCFYTGFSN